MTYCGEQTFVKWNPHEREAVSLRCRSWTCPDCSPARKRQLIAQGHRGKPNTFITLTCRRGQVATPDAAARALSDAWRIVHKRAMREALRDPSKRHKPAGKSPPGGWPIDKHGHVPRQVSLENGRLDYLVVIEAHKSGWPHLHILSRSKWIAVDWLRGQMAELLNSPVVFVQRITKRSQVAAYVSKYCSKCEHKFGTAKRYWESKNYPLTPFEGKKASTKAWWEQYRDNCTLKETVQRWEAQGWQIEIVSVYKVLAKPPP